MRSPRCGHDDSDSNVRCAQICPHDVPHTLDSSDYLSIIEAQEDCMAQDIHLDSLEDGWSFLTAMECDQEVLILWNGYKYVCLLEPLIRDRQTACDHVRTKVQMEAAFTWTDGEWQSTIEPRVWTWLCQSQADKTFGSSPELKIKRVRISKGWTIAVDSRTQHGGAPRVVLVRTHCVCTSTRSCGPLMQSRHMRMTSATLRSKMLRSTSGILLTCP